MTIYINIAKKPLIFIALQQVSFQNVKVYLKPQILRARKYFSLVPHRNYNSNVGRRQNYC